MTLTSHSGVLFTYSSGFLFTLLSMCFQNIMLPNVQPFHRFLFLKRINLIIFCFKGTIFLGKKATFLTSVHQISVALKNIWLLALNRRSQINFTGIIIHLMICPRQIAFVAFLVFKLIIHGMYLLFYQ